MAGLPSGTVTVLVTGVDGGAALWAEAPEPMRAALAQYDVLFENVVRRHARTPDCVAW